MIDLSQPLLTSRNRWAYPAHFKLSKSKGSFNWGMESPKVLKRNWAPQFKKISLQTKTPVRKILSSQPSTIASIPTRAEPKKYQITGQQNDSASVKMCVLAMVNQKKRLKWITLCANGITTATITASIRAIFGSQKYRLGPRAFWPSHKHLNPISKSLKFRKIRQ